VHAVLKFEAAMVFVTMKIQEVETAGVLAKIDEDGV
jgi:hypothetical protein